MRTDSDNMKRWAIDYLFNNPSLTEKLMATDKVKNAPMISSEDEFANFLLNSRNPPEVVSIFAEYNITFDSYKEKRDENRKQEFLNKNETKWLIEAIAARLSNE